MKRIAGGDCGTFFGYKGGKMRVMSVLKGIWRSQDSRARMSDKVETVHTCSGRNEDGEGRWKKADELGESQEVRCKTLCYD